MPSTPSSIQDAYASEVAKTVLQNLLKDVQLQEKAALRMLVGSQGSQHLLKLPDSLIVAWAGEGAERLRKLILTYFKETGVFPE